MSEGQQEKEKRWEMGTSSHANRGEKTQIPLEQSLEELMHDLPFISPDVCIYRVPQALRRINEKAYTPQMVSIGPFHRGKHELQAMEKHKLRYLRAFLDRTDLSLKDCVRMVKKCEKSVRDCYAEIIDLTSDEFVKMIILDSCLIIEILLRLGNIYNEEQDYLNKRIMGEGLMTDMILLENQLPFFVLQRLYDLAFHNKAAINFLFLSMVCFSRFMIEKDFGNMVEKMGRQRSGSTVKHFVDMLRICHQPPSLSLPSNKTRLKATLSATDLYDGGMKFKKGSSKCLLDIQYTTGVLEIPHIVITEGSEYVFRNIIALEDCHYPFDSYMVEYIFFMDTLINTAKDADLLIQNGIIENWVSDSAAVATLFNRLGMGTTVTNKYYFYRISEEMDSYSNIRWNRWRAAFKRDYCSTPWMFASTIAAILLLLLTFVQTICSIISL